MKNDLDHCSRGFALVVCLTGCLTGCLTAASARAALEFEQSEKTYIQVSESEILYRSGVKVRARISSLEVAEGSHQVDYSRTVRSLRSLKKAEFPGLFDAEKLSGKVLVAAIGGTDDSLILELRALGIDAYGVDIFLYPHQRQSPFLFQADLRDTGLSANQFDGILMSWGPLSYSDSERESVMESVLKEMSRILKPRGKLLVSPVKLSMLGPIADRVEALSYRIPKHKIRNPFDTEPSYLRLTKRTRLSLVAHQCVRFLIE